MLTAVVISFSEISSDARVLKQIRTLSRHFRVVTIGYGGTPESVCAHLVISTKFSFFRSCFIKLCFALRLYKLFSYQYYGFGRIISFLKPYSPDVFLLNDCSSWPIVDYINPMFCICDAHEFSPDELSDNLRWRLIYQPYKKWCALFASKVAYRFSVESNICSMWSTYLDRKFHLLPNSSTYEPPLSDATINMRLKRNIFVHHGVAHPSRRIENMILSFSKLNNPVESRFYLTGTDSDYIEYLQDAASRVPRCSVEKPIPQHLLRLELTRFSYALISIYPSNPNYKYCLPNKLYQCIQARLPIVTGPTPSIAQIVRRFKIGVVSDDFSPESLSNAIEEIQLLDYSLLIENLNIAASSLCWEADQQRLLDAFKVIVSNF